MLGSSAAAMLLALQVAGLPAHAPWAAAASAQASAQPLGRGEVLLELGAMGQDTSEANLAEFRVTVTARGKSEEAARAEHGVISDRLREAARAAGVAPTDFDPGDVEVGPDPGAAMIDLTQPMRLLGPGASADTNEEVYSAASSVKVRVRAIERVEGLRTALQKVDGISVGTPQYSAEDTSAARRGARRKAVAQAQADAETYAAALNMRVVRIARVTERTGTDIMSMMLTEMSGGEGRMSEMFEADEGRVPAVVFVGIDFILAPR